MKKTKVYRPRRGMRFDRSPQNGMISGVILGADNEPIAAGGSVMTVISAQCKDAPIARESTLTSASAGFWTTDATSLKGIPQNNAEWTDAMTAAGFSGNPSHLYLFQEPSSHPQDSIGSKHLVAAGTLSYSTAITGWTAKGITTTSGVGGTMTNNTFTDVNAQSKLVLLYQKMAAPGTTRTIMRFGTLFDDDACVEINATPLLLVGEGDGTRTSGASDPLGSVRPIVLRINDTGNTVDAFTDQEKIIAGTQACNGTELCFGGDNSATYFPGPCDYVYAAVWVGAAAEMTNAQVKALLEMLGWTVAWSP